MAFSDSCMSISKPNIILKLAHNRRYLRFVSFSGYFSQNFMPHVVIMQNFQDFLISNLIKIMI